MKFNGKFNIPSRRRLDAVPESSVASSSGGGGAAAERSVTTAVKSMAHVLLGPTGRTPIDNIIQMQHFQLWGFLLVVAGLLYIVWLMQKKLDSIDKQYKEQFVLLHRLFKSHQDLQVEVRKTSTAYRSSAQQQQARTLPSVPSVPSVMSVVSINVDDSGGDATATAEDAEEDLEQNLELEEEPELCFDEEEDVSEGSLSGHEEEIAAEQEEEWNEPVEEDQDVLREKDFETFE